MPHYVIYFCRGISPSPNNAVTKPTDTTIRARRLMKEYKEIQRLQSLRADPIFTVSFIFILNKPSTIYISTLHPARIVYERSVKLKYIVML